MNKNTSIFLDLLRFVAALDVMLSHSQHMVVAWLPSALCHANVAVAIFFVLSGFVIRYVVSTKEKDWKAYAVARALRIYPVAIVTICVTLMLDRIGQMMHPEYYASLSFFNLATSAWGVTSYLTFSSELWFRHVVVGSAEPYWSLSFEVCYYLLLALVMFTPWRWRLVVALAWSLLVGPKILAYAPVWLLGVGCFEFLRKYKNNAFMQGIGGYGMLSAGALMLLATHFIPGKVSIAMFRFSDWRHVLPAVAYYWCIGISIVLIIAGFDLVAANRVIFPDSIAKAIRWLAGGSFTLYLVHLPLLTFLTSVFPDARNSKQAGALLVFSVMLIAFLVAELAERRKNNLRNALQRVKIMKGFSPNTTSLQS